MKSFFIFAAALALSTNALAQTKDATPLAASVTAPAKAGAMPSVEAPTLSSGNTTAVPDNDPAKSIVSTDPAQFRQAIKDYNATSSHPETQKYLKQTLYPYFGETYSPVLKACFAKKPAPAPVASTEPFIFVMTLDAKGHILKINLNKRTTTSDCMMKKLATDILPPPPFVPFSHEIDMHFKE